MICRALALLQVDGMQDLGLQVLLRLENEQLFGNAAKSGWTYNRLLGCYGVWGGQ